MKQYTVPQFRANLREALNAVEAGDMVVVTRHGVSFVLTSASHWNDKQVQAQKGFTTLVTDQESSDIKPEIGHHNKNGFYVLGADPAKVNGDRSVEYTPPTAPKIKSVATPPNETESKLQTFAKEKGIRFCGNGHAIPAGRSKCMGKGCKYA